MFSEPTLECQGCGVVLMYLTPDEAQKVADNPYNFVVYCSGCRKWR